MSDYRFPDVSGILEAIEADERGLALWERTSLRLPSEVSDYERKYSSNGARLPIHTRRLAFQVLIHQLSSGKRAAFDVQASETFSGVDEGFEFTGNGERVLHRLRFGSNRPCQWTTKTQTKRGDNTERRRSSVHISYKDLAKVRANLIRTARTHSRVRHMLVGQSGEFWFVKDRTTGYVVEIALYKAGRAEPDATSPLLLLAEIAPWECPNVEVAMNVIRRYEQLLKLGGRVIKSSNMEIFRKK